MIECVARILSSAEKPGSPIRPTVLYNEGWMLRLLLAYLEGQSPESHPFRFLQGARWYSEALLYSAFLARAQMDELAEGWTHADGVIGHFSDSSQTPTAELCVSEGASQFVVIEAKMLSGLSTGVRNCSGYDQAARTVACIAAVLSRANIPPSNLARIAFFVVAPKAQIDRDIFGQRVTKRSILQRVSERVYAYAGERDEWFEKWFKPTLELAEVDLLPWEDALENLPDGLLQFYENCLCYNQRRTADAP